MTKMKVGTDGMVERRTERDLRRIGMLGIATRIILTMTMTGPKATRGGAARGREAGKGMPESHTQVVRTSKKRRLPRANGADITIVAVIRLSQWTSTFINVKREIAIVNGGGKSIGTDILIDLTAVLPLLPAQKSASRREGVDHVLPDMYSSLKRLRSPYIKVHWQMSN
jgi:hypothetical protein